MVVIYGITDDAIDYGYIDVDDDHVLEYLLDRDRCEWIVPGTLED